MRWARLNDAIVVEDDYDGEFRYDRQPIGALQGLDPEHVVYAGTTSKTIAPGIRIGWLVLPPSWSSRSPRPTGMAAPPRPPCINWPWRNFWPADNSTATSDGYESATDRATSSSTLAEAFAVTEADRHRRRTAPAPVPRRHRCD